MKGMEMSEKVSINFNTNEEPRRIVHSWDRTPPMVKIKLDRGQKGGVGWEITCEDDTIDGAIAKIRETNAKLLQEFGDN
jgi:hypothetical protein